MHNRTKIFLCITWYLLLANTTFAYDRQDTLRGSNGAHRAWWNVQEYYLSISIDTAKQSISGMNILTFSVNSTPTDSLQIDLQEPMLLDSAVYNSKRLTLQREGNVYWVSSPGFKSLNADQLHKLTLYYHGVPHAAKTPPWDGGFIWTNDSTGKPWVSVACQGLGASVWWPCKDYQADEPDKGMTMNYYVPYGLTIISNGQLIDKKDTEDKSASFWVWRVKNPINTYDVSFYMGNYTGWTDTLMGEKGKLKLSFFALKHNEATAKKHFAVTKQMLHCFENWMGPYPFYEDGYKLVEAPFLGMEHQSAIAYGNLYKMGYLGRDRSGTGVGTKFDFIIVHESGHEWFGNNITAADIADNWIHEGFTTYTEALFAECAFGKKDAFAYTRGEWKNIINNRPVIGDYGVNDEGAGDKYDKGSAVVHMVRAMMNDDEKFRQLLRKLNSDYYHKFVTSKELEQNIIDYTGLNLRPVFDQYLRTTRIPVLEWYIDKKKRLLYYRFTETVEGFELPLYITTTKKNEKVVVKNEWQSINWKKGGYNVSFSEDFLIRTKP